MARRGLAVKAASSALGLGHLPLAPGTWASAAAAFAYYLMRLLPDGACLAALWAALLAVSVLGLLVHPGAERVYGGKDARPFVLDEVAGQWLTCLLFWRHAPLATALWAFVAFRLFDVAKPFPIRRIEKLPGGWGVMLDDVAAALYAAAALNACSWFLVCSS